MELSASPPIRRRILALWFARLPTDRLQRRRPASPDDPPLVLSIKSNNARILYAVDRKAARQGLNPGMALASARAMVRELAVAEADETADAKLLTGIADWCDRFTPFVAIDGVDGLLLDVTGATHLFGGEAAMLETVRASIACQGFTVRAALAGTAAAARALARYADATIAAAGTEAEVVAFLPVAALDLDSKDTHALRRAGLKTIAQVAGRTRAELTARFGKEMVFKLDRALGQSEKPISPRRILPDYMAEHRFAEPVTAEDFIAGSILSLAGSLCGLLEERGQGARALEASFFRSDGAVNRIVLETARPLRDPKIIARLFRDRLDALADPIDPGFGFDLIRLGALRAERLVPESVGLDAKPDDGKEIAFLIDRLAARFGSHRILTFQPQDTHIPEAAGVAVPAQHAPDTKCNWEARVPGEAPRRPLQMLTKPELIDVMAQVPDGPPLRFRWHRALHAVVHAEGPERITMEWWRNQNPQPTRDYFRVEDEAGRRFWLYRDGLYDREQFAPRWYVHGLFA
ncbi:MAG: Y-family DNA polymerase [Rhizomicrobium sp.]